MGFGSSLSGYPANYINKDSHPILALHGKKETVQRFDRVMPFIKKAQSANSKVELKVYDNAGHSWDVPRAGMKDGYNQEVTEDANKRIVAFFKKNFKVFFGSFPSKANAKSIFNPIVIQT